MKFEDLYYEEITQNSFQEMIELCKWLNEIHGYHPVIIGGWAVYLYHPTLGSRDIDILFPNRKLKHDVINNYLFSHNYQSEGLIEKEYFKEVETPKGKEKIIIDACSVEDINRLKGTEIIIPWSLAFEYQTSQEIEGVELYVPSVEALLLYKTKAALDRENDLKTTFDPFFLQQKIRKDYHDIITLITFCKIDFNLLNELLNNLKFYEYFKLVCEKIGARKEISYEYEKNWETKIKEFINNLNSK